MSNLQLLGSETARQKARLLLNVTIKQSILFVQPLNEGPWKFTTAAATCMSFVKCPIPPNSMSSQEQSDQILREVGNKIQSYPFSYRGAAILSGKEEGAYGWVTVNYLLENFIKVLHRGCQQIPPSPTVIRLYVFLQCTATADRWGQLYVYWSQSALWE